MDVKVSDFGVSVWKTTGKFKRKPFYKGDKGIYELQDFEYSFTYGFDVRFGRNINSLSVVGYWAF